MGGRAPWVSFVSVGAFLALVALVIVYPHAIPGTYRDSGAVLPGVLYALTNGDRAAAGLPALSQNALLDKAAQMKAEDMATRGYYSHTTPEGYQPFHWFDVVGYTYLNVGENLDVIYSGDENTINNAWMGSPGHRANILLPQFTEIGVGVAEGTYKGVPATFAVQLFATPLPPTAPPVRATVPVTLSVHAPVPAHPVATVATKNTKTTPRPVETVKDVPVPVPAIGPIFRIPYTPQTFIYSLQIFTLSINESTRQFLAKLASER